MADSLYIDPLALLPTPEKLKAWSGELANTYQLNRPFPHICIDGFLEPQVAKNLLSDFPSPQKEIWFKTQLQNEKKLSCSEEQAMPASIRSFLFAMNGSTMVRFLEELTGISGLIPDPYFSGGGLHQIVRGGKLDLHIDFNRHHLLNLDRRLNLLLYLNENWSEEYGGHFEMWNRSDKSDQKKLLPLFNRCVVFSTTEDSLHGHPDPLACPDGVSRKSLALYYYTNGRPKSEKVWVHGTVFHSRPKKGFKASVRALCSTLAHELLPGIILRFLRGLSVRFQG